MNKIEAAEALANAWDMLRRGDADWCDVNEACSAYRSASVPSDEDLGRVAYEGAYKSCAKWDDVPKEYGRLWTDSAAAVREWVQRDSGVKLTDEEREWLCEVVINQINRTEEDAKRKGSILRKLGREPDPVWEWDSHNSMWTLGGKVDSQIFPCASVMLSSAGLRARVYLSEMNATSVTVDGFKEACEWCEQKIREARQ